MGLLIDLDDNPREDRREMPSRTHRHLSIEVRRESFVVHYAYGEALWEEVHAEVLLEDRQRLLRLLQEMEQHI